MYKMFKAAKLMSCANFILDKTNILNLKGTIKATF